MNIFHSFRGRRARPKPTRAIWVLAGWLALPGFAPAAKAASPETVYVVPHTHWEGAVFKTREEYLEMGLPHIVKALYLLKKYPDYRFVLDQMCYVRPFVERYPAEVPALRQFLAQGRLQIAGGTDTMHDNNIPAGESIVRQYLLGKSYFRDALGYDVTTGWGLDTFGHNAQMPQILKLAGMKSYWFQRGVPSIDTPSEFFWQGIDGTRIPAFWLPIGYGALFELPSNPAAFTALVEGRFNTLTPFSHGNERVLMAGADVWEPEEALPVMVQQFDDSGHAPFALRLSIPADFEAAVARRADRPVISGELNPVFQGIYSSRIDVKQAMRTSERLLTTAEKLNTMAAALGGPGMRDRIEAAWEPVLFNQAHDLSSGVMVDKVYDDSMQRYHQAHAAAGELVRANLEFLSGRADTAGEGVPVAVFNTLSWPRTDVAEVDISFSDPAVTHFALRDPAGNAIPVQVLQELRNDDNGIRQAHIAFMARDVPAMGYAIYHAVPNAAGPANPPSSSHGTMHEDKAALENEFYRASFDLWTGALDSLVVKADNWETLAKPGNVVAREHDGGDFWELYGTLNGGRLTAMKKEIAPPRPGYTEWSNDFVGGSGVAAGGPVFSEFHIAHPFGKNHFATRVRLYNGLRRIDISTELTNQEEFVRYRAVFPTSIANGKATEEIAFGAIERPQRQEFPAQNWSDWSDGAKGFALLNRGLPGNNIASGEMMLSLMRSARLISYGYIGGLEPGVGSDTGLGIGRKYTLDYAVLPHSGDWRSAELWRAGLEFNNPLLVRTVASHAGVLGKKWGILDVSAADVVVSALKPGRDGTSVVRVYEAAGKPAQGVRLSLHVPVTDAHETNLIEDAGAAVAVSGDSLNFDLKPFEIRTFKLRIKANSAGGSASGR
ncbi:MAG: glycoside hydrolase family 38 C-terminal domain-containing protein [Bryobacteraceae bacterium]